jgi:hypothetical protein
LHAKVLPEPVTAQEPPLRQGLLAQALMKVWQTLPE